jgi:hypothetical protein
MRMARVESAYSKGGEQQPVSKADTIQLDRCSQQQTAPSHSNMFGV